MDKKTMRKEMLSIRNQITKEDILKKSQIIEKKLRSLEQFKQAENIMFFASFASEVYTYDMIKKCLEEGKNILLPYIEDNQKDMNISQIKSLDNLTKGYKGIPEIKKELRTYFDKNNIDIVITPCVCYDFDRYRIGYGKGFYDKFFASVNDTFKIGICFDEMLIEKIPHDENDIKVDMIITDKKTVI